MLKDKVLSDLDTVIKTATLLKIKVQTAPSTPTGWLELGNAASALGHAVTAASTKLMAWASIETDKLSDHEG